MLKYLGIFLAGAGSIIATSPMNCNLSLWPIAVSLVSMCILVGCPRMAYIDLFNNTGVPISIKSFDNVYTVEPDHTISFIFPGKDFTIESELGKWRYPRSIPHGGEDGPFFDGTLRVQLNRDGTVYAIRTGEFPPIAVFVEQPLGYPLSPVE